MTMVARGVGGLMMVYSALYLAQYLFSAFYDNPQRVWDVMNIISGLGILIALVANFRQMRSESGSNPAPWRGACTLFYANAALAIWFFHNWIGLLTLGEGESTSVHQEIVWQFIAMMIPLVLATTGWRLWRANFRQL